MYVWLPKWIATDAERRVSAAETDRLERCTAEAGEIMREYRSKIALPGQSGYKYQSLRSFMLGVGDDGSEGEL